MTTTHDAPIIRAVCRIAYDRRTDRIEVIGKRTTGALPSRIQAIGYDILSRTVQGWGDYNAVVGCDGFDDAAGTFLAKLDESAPRPTPTDSDLIADPDLIDTVRRRRIVPLLEENSPTTSAPLTPAEQLADALACVRYLAKIIREDGNWKDDELSGLDWAASIAGLYEEHNGEGNWGPSVGDEAILVVTDQTYDENADTEPDPDLPDLDQSRTLAENEGSRVRVESFETDSNDDDRWTGANVVTLDGPTPGTKLWVNVRDLARPTD